MTPPLRFLAAVLGGWTALRVTNLMIGGPDAPVAMPTVASIAQAPLPFVPGDTHFPENKPGSSRHALDPDPRH